MQSNEDSSELLILFSMRLPYNWSQKYSKHASGWVRSVRRFLRLKIGERTWSDNLGALIIDLNHVYSGKFKTWVFVYCAKAS